MTNAISVHTPSESEVDRVVEFAHGRFWDGEWSKASRHDRADVLDKAAVLLTESLGDLIALEVQQTGRAMREMKAQIPPLVRLFRYYAALLRTEESTALPAAGPLHNWADRVPLGVIVLMTPSSNPLVMAVKKLVPALAAGNSVILKPSALTPLTSLLLGPILANAGIPRGVFIVLPGSTRMSIPLVKHRLVRKVDMAGGTQAGQTIGSTVASNLARYTAKLGGKAPLIVFPTASIDAAVNGIAFGAFIGSGQTCVGSTRILVHNTIFTQVREKLKVKAQSIQARMGSPSNPQSTMGPVISAREFHNIEMLVNLALARGAGLVHGGDRMTGNSSLDGTSFDKGYFYPPTVLDFGTGSEPFPPLWSDDGSGPRIVSSLWREEPFGPVIVLVGFDTEQQAVDLVNDTEYSLGASVWTMNLSQAFRVSNQLRTGVVWVNAHDRNDPSTPWEVLTPSSGVDSENGREAYQAFTMKKSTIINYKLTDELIEEEDWFRDNVGDVGDVGYG